MNPNSAKYFLMSFYYDYVADGSNISKTAEKHGITNTVCFRMVSDGKTLVDKEK
jgi:hypothetical protein